MKKLLFSFIIVAAGVFVTSCGNKSAETATEAEQTEQVAKDAPAAEAEQPASLADIVAKAKAEGANWSADEWKTQFKKALEAYKPFAVAMNEAQPAQLEEITKQYADFPTLIKEFAGLAQKADGGKDITDEWIQATMQELGIPQL
jgi:hypothetical protein